MRQCLLKPPSATGDDLERKFFLVRRMVEARAPEAVGAEHYQDFFICTLSSRTIVYKGMLNSSALGIFYVDLRDPDYESLFSIYHRRFSTNTVPKWPLAQPFRFLGHNGEINTLQGNINWQASIQGNYTHPIWEGREEDFGNICDTNFSDSANLDRVAELMVRTGFPPQKAMMLLVPEAYKNHPDLEKHYSGVADFYNFFESKPCKLLFRPEAIYLMQPSLGVDCCTFPRSMNLLPQHPLQEEAGTNCAGCCSASLAAGRC